MVLVRTPLQCGSIRAFAVGWATRGDQSIINIDRSLEIVSRRTFKVAEEDRLSLSVLLLLVVHAVHASFFLSPLVFPML